MYLTFKSLTFRDNFVVNPQGLSDPSSGERRLAKTRYINHQPIVQSEALPS